MKATAYVSNLRCPMSEAMRRRAGVVAALAPIILFACVGAGMGAAVEGARFPEVTWEMYADPEEAGWSADGLSAARAAYEEAGSDAFLTVYDGAVLISWGDVGRRYMCHSVRKSYLSALFGLYVGEGEIDTDKTLAELGVDDVPPLTAKEKRASILHLLQSRSGVFHAAAYETPKMKERRPKRGSAEPGELWYYNNWDFNALCTIFERETGMGIFEAFGSRIADPLGMEDFRLMDGYYHLEEQHSRHPAYPFRMSARDMARFGLLLLRNGAWEGTRVIPEEWIEVSTTAHSLVPYWEGFGYGFMWWVNVDEADEKFGMYAALGYGGHMIAVLPKQDMVVVNRANTYLGEAVSRADLMRLIDAVLAAKVSSPEAEPELVPLRVDTKEVECDSTVRVEGYLGSFELEDEEIFAESIPYVIGDMIGHRVRIETEGSRLIMTDNLGQKFILVPRSKTEFLIEDMEIPIVFEMDEEGRPVEITLDGRPGWRITGRPAE